MIAGIRNAVAGSCEEASEEHKDTWVSKRGELDIAKCSKNSKIMSNIVLDLGVLVSGQNMQNDITRRLKGSQDL